MEGSCTIHTFYVDGGGADTSIRERAKRMDAYTTRHHQQLAHTQDRMRSPVTKKAMDT